MKEEMIIIDLDRIREALPDRAKVELTKVKSVVRIECTVTDPPLSEEDFKTCKKWQKDIVGDAFSEFYTEETGLNWMIFLKRIPMDFKNVTDEDVKTYTGMDLVKGGSPPQ